MTPTGIALQKIHDEIIEECARIADQWHDGTNMVARDIARLIRKLKRN